MFGLSLATQIFQDSTERTWNCVSNFVHLLWTKFNHIRHPIMPRSRKRHHSRSRSRSRSHSHEKSRDDKHRKNESHDKDGKRRKIDTFDSPHQKRSVSSENDDSIENLTDDSSINDLAVTESLNDTNNDGDNEEYKDNSSLDLKSENSEADKEGDSLSKNENSTDLDTSACDSLDNEGKIIATSKPVKLEEKLDITPNKVLSPNRIKKRMESEKKRLEKQKEREERQRIKEEKFKQKQEKEEQKKKEKEIKEEQRKKEKEEKELLKKKEREEKEQKRKEKEEKEEQKRKEKEIEKQKKQQEIDEKNKEKLKQKEQKEKTAAAFVNFFVSRKSDVLTDVKKSEESNTSLFMPFEVKSDMRLPGLRRDPMSPESKQKLIEYLLKPDSESSYLKDLKNGKPIGKSNQTWPFEENVDTDVMVIEEETDLGETIDEDKGKVEVMRVKYLKFHENRRPAYRGTWRKNSKHISARKPFAEDKDIFDYEIDSDDDWEEEEQGESINGSDDDEKENEPEDDYEVDNEFFVPHGHLSDDEVDDEEISKLSPESLKQKLKLLKDEFDQDMQSKTHKLKSRSIGCIWYNKDGQNVDEAINRYLKPLAIITDQQILIKKRSEINILNSSRKKITTQQDLDPQILPLFLKVIHGNTNKQRILIEQFLTNQANQNITVDVSKSSLLKNLKKVAKWSKCTEEGPMHNKFCWLVNEDLLKKFNL